MVRLSKIAFLTLIFIALHHFVSARKVTILLYSTDEIRSVMFTPLGGEYEIVYGDSQITRVLKNEIIQLSLEGESVSVKDLGHNFGSYPEKVVR